VTINKAEIRISSTECITLWVNGEKIAVQGESTITYDGVITSVYGTATTKRDDE
jgi:hypothetical glycosyl hydrolase